MIHSRRDFLRALAGLGTGAAAARTPDLEVKVRLDVLEEIDSWRSAMPSSAARAERLYPSGHVDTKYPSA